MLGSQVRVGKRVGSAMMTPTLLAQTLLELPHTDKAWMTEESKSSCKRLESEFAH